MNSRQKQPYLLIPIAGLCVFGLMYMLAACLYPGGSQVDKQAAGFSLLHNYWCDLFDVVAYNGVRNPGRPIAIAGMIVLTTSLGYLWYLTPRLFDATNGRHTLIQIAGISSMTIAAFLFTKYHEEVINIGGLFGFIALILIFTELFKAGELKLFRFGLLCLALSILNYFIYETGIGLPLLAALQKITFLIYFTWIGLINLAVYKKES